MYGEGLRNCTRVIQIAGHETYVIWYFDQETETFQFYGVQSHGEMVDVW